MVYIQGIFSKGAGTGLSANLCDTCEPLRVSASHLRSSASKGCHLRSLAITYGQVTASDSQISVCPQKSGVRPRLQASSFQESYIIGGRINIIQWSVSGSCISCNTHRFPSLCNTLFSECFIFVDHHVSANSSSGRRTFMGENTWDLLPLHATVHI